MKYFKKIDHSRYLELKHHYQLSSYVQLLYYANVTAEFWYSDGFCFAQRWRTEENSTTWEAI